MYLKIKNIYKLVNRGYEYPAQVDQVVGFLLCFGYGCPPDIIFPSVYCHHLQPQLSEQ